MSDINTLLQFVVTTDNFENLDQKHGSSEVVLKKMILAYHIIENSLVSRFSKLFQDLEICLKILFRVSCVILYKEFITSFSCFKRK